VTVQLRNAGGAVIGTASGTTNNKGIFNSGWFLNLTGGTYVAEVTSLSRSGYTWNNLLDPTPNDTDLDGDNLPDQQFTVTSGAAAKGPLSGADSTLVLDSATDTAAVPALAAQPANVPLKLALAAVDQVLSQGIPKQLTTKLHESLQSSNSNELDEWFALE